MLAAGNEDARIRQQRIGGGRLEAPIERYLSGIDAEPVELAGCGWQELCLVQRADPAGRRQDQSASAAAVILFVQ